MVDAAGQGALAGSIVAAAMIALKAVDVWLSRPSAQKNGNGRHSSSFLSEMRREVADHHTRHAAALRDLFQELRDHHGDEVAVLTRIEASAEQQIRATERLTDAVHGIGK